MASFLALFFAEEERRQREYDDELHRRQLEKLRARPLVKQKKRPAPARGPLRTRTGWNE